MKSESFPYEEWAPERRPLPVAGMTGRCSTHSLGKR